jgi:hypothetical protein
MKKLEKELIEEIIKKGGIYGEIANLYKNDPIKSRQFIFECFEQVNQKTIANFWGRKLSRDLKYFCENAEK